MKYLIALLLFVTVATADPYIVIWVNNSMSASGKQEILKQIKMVGLDKEEISPASLPRYRQNSDTNQLGRALCVRIDDLGVQNWRFKTVEQAETAIENKLSEEDKSKIDLNGRTRFLNLYTKDGEE